MRRERRVRCSSLSLLPRMLLLVHVLGAASGSDGEPTMSTMRDEATSFMTSGEDQSSASILTQLSPFVKKTLRHPNVHDSDAVGISKETTPSGQIQTLLNAYFQDSGKQTRYHKQPVTEKISGTNVYTKIRQKPSSNNLLSLLTKFDDLSDGGSKAPHSPTGHIGQTHNGETHLMENGLISSLSSDSIETTTSSSSGLGGIYRQILSAIANRDSLVTQEHFVQDEIPAKVDVPKPSPPQTDKTNTALSSTPSLDTPAAELASAGNLPINPYYSPITPNPASISYTNVQNCLKGSWCALFVAVGVSVGATAALAVPFFIPAVLGRRRRSQEYFIISRDNAAAIVGDFQRYKDNDFADFPNAEKLFFQSITGPESESSVKMYKKFKDFLLSKEDTLLNITVREVAKSNHILIPHDILKQIGHEKEDENPSNDSSSKKEDNEELPVVQGTEEQDRLHSQDSNEEETENDLRAPEKQGHQNGGQDGQRIEVIDSPVAEKHQQQNSPSSIPAQISLPSLHASTKLQPDHKIEAWFVEKENVTYEDTIPTHANNEKNPLLNLLPPSSHPAPFYEGNVPGQSISHDVKNPLFSSLLSVPFPSTNPQSSPLRIPIPPASNPNPEISQASSAFGINSMYPPEVPVQTQGTYGGSTQHKDEVFDRIHNNFNLDNTNPETHVPLSSDRHWFRDSLIFNTNIRGSQVSSLESPGFINNPDGFYKVGEGRPYSKRPYRPNLQNDYPRFETVEVQDPTFSIPVSQVDVMDSFGPNVEQHIENHPTWHQNSEYLPAVDSQIHQLNHRPHRPYLHQLSHQPSIHQLNHRPSLHQPSYLQIPSTFYDDYRNDHFRISGSQPYHRWDYQPHQLQSHQDSFFSFDRQPQYQPQYQRLPLEVQHRHDQTYQPYGSGFQQLKPFQQEYQPFRADISVHSPHQQNQPDSASNVLLIRPDSQNESQLRPDTVKFFQTVCSVVEAGDIPDNEITRFIENHCTILQYSGVI